MYAYLPSVQTLLSNVKLFYHLANLILIKGVIYKIVVPNYDRQDEVIYKNTPRATKTTNRFTLCLHIRQTISHSKYRLKITVHT